MHAKHETRFSLVFALSTALPLLQSILHSTINIYQYHLCRLRPECPWRNHQNDSVPVGMLIEYEQIIHVVVQCSLVQYSWNCGGSKSLSSGCNDMVIYCLRTTISRLLILRHFRQCKRVRTRFINDDAKMIDMSNTCFFPSTLERAVISDYVPKPFRGQARGAMLAASIVAALGLLKVRSFKAQTIKQ